VTASNGTCSSGNSAQAQATTAACTGNTLTNGVPVTGISGATGSQQFWTMTVPAGATNLVIQTSGGTGDADLYVRFGSAPNLTTYDCRPFTSGNAETCTFPAPSAGTWHVMLNGYAAYSGLSLVGSYTPPSSCTATTEVEPNNSTAAPQVISGSCNQISGTFLNDTATGQDDYFRLSLPAGKSDGALSSPRSTSTSTSTARAPGGDSTNGGTTADTASYQHRASYERLRPRLPVLGDPHH
jgi:hypothetical protein